MIIDFHTHLLELGVLRRVGSNTVAQGWGTLDRPPVDPGGLAARTRIMTDPAGHIEDMDRRGIDRHVISTSTVIQHTGWAEPTLQAELERTANREVERWVSVAPDRFVGSFTLPLRDIDAALTEVVRATDAGLTVANLPAAMDGEYLGAERYRPVWEAIRERGVVTFFHPDGSRDPWLQRYALWNSIGQPFEEAKLLSSLILDGILDTYPDLTIVMAHGGGFLPHYPGRVDRNAREMPDMIAKNISKLPSDYLRLLYYDTCVYDVAVLEALTALFGPDRLVMGSDFPVGESDPVGFLRQAPSLSDDIDRVLGGTAAELLGLAVGTAGEMRPLYGDCPTRWRRQYR